MEKIKKQPELFLLTVGALALFNFHSQFFFGVVMVATLGYFYASQTRAAVGIEQVSSILGLQGQRFIVDTHRLSTGTRYFGQD